MGKDTRCNEIGRVLEQIAHLIAEQEASLIANDEMSASVISKEYESFRARQPIHIWLDEVRDKLQPESGVISKLVESYRLQKVFATISDFQCNSVKRNEYFSRIKKQMEQVSRMVKHRLSHLCLIPDPEQLRPVTLDGGSNLNLDQADAAEHVSGPLPSIQEIECLRPDASGYYSISIDETTSSYADLEIGDSNIMITLPDTSKGLDIDVYFNGISDDCKQMPRWLGNQKLFVQHGFDNPELMNVTLIQGEKEDSRIFIFWAGIEKELISSVLEKVYPESRQRLEWWWKPQERLGGWSPVKCIQQRREDAVLDSLYNEFDLTDLSDLIR